MEQAPHRAVVYPESDGKPMADNTLQFEWIVTIKENLDALLPDFVAGDLLWYPVEGQPRLCQAPDVMVAMTRPKGHRRSYKQWEEAGVAPQVVFEVLSHSNVLAEILRKQQFYERYGVREYYLVDPDAETVIGWIRDGAHLREIEEIDGWVSPTTGIRFTWEGERLVIRRPNGEAFTSFRELQAQLTSAEARAESAEARAAALEQKLRELGIDPSDV